MKHFALALVLACVLSGTASAGEIPTTGAVAPTTPSTVTAIGGIPSTGATAPQDSTAILTIIMMFLDIVR